MMPVSASDYRRQAQRRLPRMLFDYIDGGSFAETSLGRNQCDFQNIALRQRVMVETSALQMECTLFGHRYSMPVGLAPVGIAGLYARRGEAQAARAAQVAGVPMCLSTLSICSIEEVASAGEPPWFQLYMIKNRGFMRELLARVRAVHCPVLVFTVDMPISGGRYKDYRHTGVVGAGAFNRALQGLRRPGWVWDVLMRGTPLTPGNIASVLPPEASLGEYLSWVGANLDRSVGWADLDFVREHWDGPLVIKGILDPADAKQAVRAGADGIIVSNHGGRQLDGVRSPISVLPAIVDAVGGATEIMLDSGLRNGLDVLRALALGARACFLGRMWAWALAAGGEEAIGAMLGTIRHDLATAMVLSGCTDIAKAGPDLIDRLSLNERHAG